jgi:diguanylate cyclase (GGDEF)-like protein
MKILIAEDDPASRTMLQKMLERWGYEVVLACDGETAWQALNDPDPPQLAILDWIMPDPDGIEICRKIRAAQEHSDESPSSQELEIGPDPYIYIILLTAKSEKESMIQGLQSGADDYIVKPFNPDELQARLRAGSRILKLQNQLVSVQQKLQSMARIDYLTSIYNRRAVIQLLKKELARSDRDGRPMSLAMLDVDHFKAINDTYGHAVGDSVLKECVQSVRSYLRDYDLVGRFGGEEFLIVLPGVDLEQARDVCERIRLEVRNRDMSVQDCHLRLTVSLGVTTWQSGMDADRLIMKADDALYLAKRKGRDRVELG